jgi:dihydroneopterin aldolase
MQNPSTFVGGFFFMAEYISTVALEGVEIIAPIGYYEFERKQKNTFLLDITVQFKAPESNYDEIEGTLNYEILYRILNEEMHHECALMEDAARRIMARVRQLPHDLCAIDLSLRKKNPPMEGEIEFSKVGLSWKA